MCIRDRSETAPVTGMIRTGDDLVWTFDGTGGWAFVLSQQLPGQMGWYREPIYSPDDWTASAGEPSALAPRACPPYILSLIHI